MNIFATMSQIDTRKLVEKKNGFTYLSWAHALRLLKENVPDAQVVKHVWKQTDGSHLPFMQDAQGHAYVQVTVMLGKDQPSTTEIMPVLNHANRPIQKPNSFEVNASMQRCMAKAISMATGLGIHLYAGEDMPAPASAGPDNSGQKAEGEAASGQITSIIRDDRRSDAEESSEAVNSPKKIKPPLSLEQEVALCPDMDALKALYNRRPKWLAEEVELFTKKKQELLNG